MNDLDVYVGIAIAVGAVLFIWSHVIDAVAQLVFVTVKVACFVFSVWLLLTCLKVQPELNEKIEYTVGKVIWPIFQNTTRAAIESFFNSTPSVRLFV